MESHTDWPAIVLSMMAEHKISGTRLAKTLGINRTTFHKFLKGNTAKSMTIDKLARICLFLGHELIVLPLDKRKAD